jgi:hypothetical protein
MPGLSSEGDILRDNDLKKGLFQKRQKKINESQGIELHPDLAFGLGREWSPVVCARRYVVKINHNAERHLRLDKS